MEGETYIVLRLLGGAAQAKDPFQELVMRGEPNAKGLESAESVTVEVSTAALAPADYRDLRRDPRARVAAPIPVRLIRPVSDAEAGAEMPPEPGATWGVQATGALQSPYTGQGVTVAVLDTGIDADHEAFKGIKLIQKDFTGEGNGDKDGHGTHVAGTIFGQTTQGVRYSVAPGVRRALIGKVLGAEGGGTTAGIIEAIQWAVKEKAHVINMSLGIDFPGLVQAFVGNGLPVELATSLALADYRDNIRLFDTLVAYIGASARITIGALLVAAAGNESKRQLNPKYQITVSPPAAADGIVSVAALRSTGAPHTKLRVAPFSNIGAQVAGPGVGIYSAKLGGGYTQLSGTSMASPHVTGVAALWAERQLQRNGMVNIRALGDQLRGNTRRDRLPNAAVEDVGEGLVAAPLD
jgi:subtilisin family serine protease